MVCLMFPNQVAHSLKVTYQAVRLWSGQLKKRDTAMLSTPSLPPPPQPMDAHKSFPPLSNVSKQWAARGLQLRQFTDICLPQFGKFLVYWDKLCLCSQMFKFKYRARAASKIRFEAEQSRIEIGFCQQVCSTSQILHNVRCQQKNVNFTRVWKLQPSQVGLLMAHLLLLLVLLLLRWRKAAGQLFRRFIPVCLARPPPFYHKLARTLALS